LNAFVIQTKLNHVNFATSVSQGLQYIAGLRPKQNKKDVSSYCPCCAPLEAITPISAFAKKLRELNKKMG
jgi:hypothetical protein